LGVDLSLVQSLVDQDSSVWLDSTFKSRQSEAIMRLQNLRIITGTFFSVLLAAVAVYPASARPLENPGSQQLLSQADNSGDNTVPPPRNNTTDTTNSPNTPPTNDLRDTNTNNGSTDTNRSNQTDTNTRPSTDTTTPGTGTMNDTNTTPGTGTINDTNPTPGMDGTNTTGTDRTNGTTIRRRQEQRIEQRRTTIETTPSTTPSTTTPPTTPSNDTTTTPQGDQTQQSRPPVRARW
jgi:hypothetical protein